MIFLIKSMSKKKRNKPFIGTPLIKCLTECQKGDSVNVLSVNTGFKAKRRLANLGVVPGVIIKKKHSAPWKGPLGIIVKGSDIVIGRGLASKIMVECEGTCTL